MKSYFQTELDIGLKPKCGDGIWVLQKPLVYYSNLLKTQIAIPAGFETDLASVPRMPFVYLLWGGKAHREGVLHDYLYRCDSNPIISFTKANSVFLEAMKSRGKPLRVRWPMFLGVAVGGYFSYHKKLVGASLG